MAREFGSIGVVGLGTMGAGIAEVFARSGRKVIGYEPTADALERGRGHLQHSTDRAVARGKLATEAQEAILNLVTFTTSLGDLGGCDLVIEAVPEQLALKLAIFADLDRICGPDSVLATNTSSLSVTDIAVGTKRPDHVVGMHFFNPAPVMRLVEVVGTIVTDPEVLADVESLAAALGKTDVTITDRAGFIANALLFGYLNRAVSMYETHRASRDDIDAAMTDGVGLPMGPFALLDLIGVDTAEDILATIYRQTGGPLHIPARTLAQMVTARLLGRKTGRGFYSYDESGRLLPESAASATPAPPSRPGPGRTTVRAVSSSTPAPKLARLRGACAEAGVAVVDGPGAPQDTGGSAEAPAASHRGGVVLVADIASEVGPDGPLSTGVLAVTDPAGRVIDAAMASGRATDVIGLRLAGTPGSKGVVEIVRTVSSSEQAVAAGVALAADLGRRAIVCPDRAGGLVEALLIPHLGDAIRMLEEGYADADDIDAVMTLGCGYPVGPIALADQLGLDHVLGVQRAIYDETRAPGLAPSPLLAELVAAERTFRGGTTP